MIHYSIVSVSAFGAVAFQQVAGKGFWEARAEDGVSIAAKKPFLFP